MSLVWTAALIALELGHLLRRPVTVRSDGGATCTLRADGDARAPLVCNVPDKVLSAPRPVVRRYLRRHYGKAHQ